MERRYHRKKKKRLRNSFRIVRDNLFVFCSIVLLVAFLLVLVGLALYFATDMFRGMGRMR